MSARLSSVSTLALGLALGLSAAGARAEEGSMIIDLPMATPQTPGVASESSSAPVPGGANAPAAAHAPAAGADAAGDKAAGGTLSGPKAAAPRSAGPSPASTAPTSSARATPTIVAPLADEGDKPDETALRYYAARGETARVNTELERLARLYPGWTPPLDLFNQDTVGAPDEEALWSLFAADRLDELRAAIEARKKNEPGWQPSRDLSVKLSRKDLRMRIMAFWREGRWQDLVDFVQQDGYQADDADVELLWTIAEAFAKTKQTPEAVSVYRSILTSGADPAARLATIQKAMAHLRMGDVEPLIAMGRTAGDGRSEFQPIFIDIVRGRISAYLHDERVDAIAEPDLRAFQEYARAAGDPNQPGLVGWYYYKTKMFREALEWFKLALERGGDAMIAHGLAHSLREVDMRRETEEVAFAWREPLVNNAILFIDILERDLTLEYPPYVEPERLARYAKVTMEIASGEGAQALAWYAYNSCQFDVALQWFQRAVAWFPKEATVYGYALTLRRLKKDKEFWDLENRYDGLFAKVLEIVFPDGSLHPPTACDMATRAQKTQQTAPGYTTPGAYGYAAGLGYGSAAQAAGYPVAGAMAAPFRLETPKIDRRLFPVATDPENRLRFAATAAPAARAPGLAAPAALEAPGLAEPMHGAWPLVASRVPGVGRMPYERYGFALLPGWNGVTGPTNPTHAAQIAPKGTLWDTETTDRPKTALQAALANAGAAAAFGGPAGGGAPFGAPASPGMAGYGMAGYGMTGYGMAGLYGMAASGMADVYGMAGGYGMAPYGPTPYAAAPQGAPLQGMAAQAPIAAQAPAAPQAPIAAQTPTAAQAPAAPQAPIAAQASSAPQTPTAAQASAAPQARAPASESPASHISASQSSAPRAAAPDAMDAQPPGHEAALARGDLGALVEQTAPVRAAASADAGALAQRALHAFNAKDYAGAVEALDQRLPLARETTDLRLIRGWSLLHLQRKDEARKVFATLSAKTGGPDKGSR